MTKPARIGIYAGSFDPVHSGHIAFALQAITEAELDEVIFMPERRPRHKPGVEHFAHRLSMLKTAAKPHRQLSVAEFVDKHFTVRRTLPQLKARLPAGAQIVILLGSDTAASVQHWEHVDELFAQAELVIGVRHPHSQAQVRAMVAAWPSQPLAVTIFSSHTPQVSSTAIRAALRANLPTVGLLASVKKYARRQWLYPSLTKRKQP